MEDLEDFYTIGNKDYFIERYTSVLDENFVKLHIGACTDHETILWLHEGKEIDELVDL